MSSLFFDRHHRHRTTTTRRVLVFTLPDGSELMVELWDERDRVTAAHKVAPGTEPSIRTWGRPIAPHTDVRA